MKGYSCELWLEGSHWKTIRMDALNPTISIALTSRLSVAEPETLPDRAPAYCAMDFRLTKRLSERRAKYEFEELH